MGLGWSLESVWYSAQSWGEGPRLRECKEQLQVGRYDELLAARGSVGK